MAKNPKTKNIGNSHHFLLSFKKATNSDSKEERLDILK
jgi:hypothetical protein